jgi:hypothetical protein
LSELIYYNGGNMKNFPAIIFVILVFILNSQNSNAQINNRVTINDGSQINYDLISSNNGDSINLKSSEVYQKSSTKSKVNSIEPLRKKVTLGLGLGIPYGIHGISAEYEPSPFIDIAFGIGSASSKVAWNFGAVGYLFNQESTIRPRISLFYGNNYASGYATGEELCPQSYEYFTGFSAGGGLKIMLIESFGLTADLFYILSNNAVDRTKELESQGYKNVSKDEVPMIYSLGFQYSF